MLVLDLEKLETLEQVPFGRNRLLAGVGAGLFAAATALVAPGRGSATTPYPCFGFDACVCCSGSTCCDGSCSPLSTSCPSADHHCWITCGCGFNYQCCDWYYANGPNNCICSGRLGACGC